MESNLKEMLSIGENVRGAVIGINLKTPRLESGKKNKQTDCEQLV